MIIPNLLDEMQADALPGGTRIAKNAFQAAHIANGLRLAECETLDEARARWRRYRGWKIAGEQTQWAYRRAIAGEEPPAPMFVVCPVCNMNLDKDGYCPQCEDYKNGNFVTAFEEAEG